MSEAARSQDPEEKELLRQGANSGLVGAKVSIAASANRHCLLDSWDVSLDTAFAAAALCDPRGVNSCDIKPLGQKA